MQFIVAPFAPRPPQINGSRLVCHNWDVSGVYSVHYPFCTIPWHGRWYMSPSLEDVLHHEVTLISNRISCGLSVSPTLRYSITFVQPQSISPCSLTQESVDLRRQNTNCTWSRYKYWCLIQISQQNSLCWYQECAQKAECEIMVEIKSYLLLPPTSPCPITMSSVTYFLPNPSPNSAHWWANVWRWWHRPCDQAWCRFCCEFDVLANAVLVGAGPIWAGPDHNSP